MATLVLSTVGNAIGGPVGGAIGALIGQSIDQQVLAPKTRGPRMGDLSVQSSSYGTQIPRIYGSMRVAGTVVWATDLVESSQAGAAKGQPDTTYSYSVSLAVALSSRTIARIGRIWADGKLLRGAEGDLKVPGKLRLYTGSEDQDADPFIASTEGLTETPAYRGMALAVFEGLDLGAFANRIPFMTFEVVADEGPITVGEILNDATGGWVDSGEAASVGGYAAYGQSRKAAVEPLVDSFGVELLDDGTALITRQEALALFVDPDLFGNSADGQRAARIERDQIPARSLPARLRLAYYDRERDFQSGEARASVGETAGTEEQRELPGVIGADAAKSLAQQMLARQWAERDRLVLRMPPAFLGLQPGDLLELDQSPSVWRVVQCTIDGFVAVVELRPAWKPTAALLGDAGRIVSNDDQVAGDAVLALFDIPAVAGQSLSVPTIMLAASCSTPGWQARTAEISTGQLSFQAQTAARKSVLGKAVTVLAPEQAVLIDEQESVDIELFDAEQWLTSCDDDALFGGTNLAVLGGELIQYGEAISLGGGRFRLSRLLRGRAGTEWAAAAHVVGEPFALIDRDSLRPVELPAFAIGSSAGAEVRNLSGAVSSTSIVLSGECLRPPSPVALGAEISASGNLSLSWTRRSRVGFAWVDEIDAPLGESREHYRVTINGPASSIEVETDQPSATIAAPDLSALGSSWATVEVRQIGDWAASRPTSCNITI